MSKADEALDKMAENARELGLDYEPAHQLPFGVGGGLVAIKTLLSRDPCTHATVAIEMIDAILAEQPAQQQEPVKFWCETCEGSGKVYQEHQAGCHVGGEFDCPDCDGRGYFASPPAQRTWIGLTHDEYDAICDKHSTMSDFDFLDDIEAKLKEKNT